MVGDVHGLKSSEIKNEQGAALNALAQKAFGVAEIAALTKERETLTA